MPGRDGAQARDAERGKRPRLILRERLRGVEVEAARLRLASDRVAVANCCIVKYRKAIQRVLACSKRLLAHEERHVRGRVGGELVGPGVAVLKHRRFAVAGAEERLERLFRQHYAPTYLASTRGTFRDPEANQCVSMPQEDSFFPGYDRPGGPYADDRRGEDRRRLRGKLGAGGHLLKVRTNDGSIRLRTS